MKNQADTTDEQLRQQVSGHYGQIAQQVMAGDPTDTCGGSRGQNPIVRDLYSSGETAELPPAAAQASLGCGNPTALIELRDGDVVLDLGSGGGIDVLLSARRVGPGGTAYGLDMNDEMLELARRNQREAGVDNVEFLKGYLEDIPLSDDSVDVIISNCVINLSPDKGRALQEAFRVLRPGGRFAVSDVVVRGSLDPHLRSNLEAWMGCIAGALDEDDYIALLAEAGFTEIDVQPTRVYHLADAADFIAESGIDLDVVAEADGHIMSAFVRATKPAAV